MPTLTVSTKGWVVIPVELRKKYGLTPGAQVQLVDYGGVLALVPLLENPIDRRPSKDIFVIGGVPLAREHSSVFLCVIFH